jgi:nucleotide-binding universal stress UspA family protein
VGYIEGLMAALQGENEARRDVVKKAFSDWRTATEIPEASAPGEACNETAQLVLKVGDAKTVRDYALGADLIVTSLAENGNGDGNIALEVALIDAGRPVIALPRHWAPITDDAPVAVAWNGSAESVHALSSALPLLRDVGKVVILHAGRNDNTGTLDRVISYLAWHGINAQGEELGKQDDPETLIAKRVSTLGAKMLVMGAYTHSRAREFVFGGVTSHMLRSTQVPLFLAH